MPGRLMVRCVQRPRLTSLLLASACMGGWGGFDTVQAAPSFTNLCSGVGVQLPSLIALSPSAGATLGVLAGQVLPALNGVVTDVNTNIVQALDGHVLTLRVYDPGTNTYVNAPAGACNLALNGLAVDNSKGITVGGGQILGLGGTGGSAPSAGDASAIAFGNGANTGIGVANALALGTGATVSAANSVALGADSVASRGAGSFSAFGLHGTQTAVGEISLGQAGALRQVTNLAAGSADTDAVNVLQLRGATAEVGSATAAALGGGSVYNAVNASLTLPSFNIRGSIYNSVGDAFTAVNIALGSTTTTTVPGAVLYDRAANGTTLSSITLGSDQGGPVVIHNLAAGIAPDDAATVGQVQAVANTSVQYTTINGVKSNTVMLMGGSPGAVTISNLAPGRQGTDAVNLDQLRSYSSGALAQSNAYTDNAVSNLKALTGREIASARRDAAGGAALALAATGLRYDDRPGKVSVGGATAYYHGQMGIAFGVASTSETGRVRINAALSASPTMDHADVGGVVGASIAIN